MKTSAKGKSAKPILDQSEWDFSDCPKDEVFQCYLYEYARTSEEFRSAYEIIRKVGTSDGFVDFGNGFRLSSNCPEFPTTPWLKIPKELRSRRVYQPFIFTGAALTPAYPDQPLTFNAETGEEAVKFEICWLATKSQIVKEFSEWVDTMMEQRAQQIRDRAVEKGDGSAGGLGRQQPHKLAADRLKALTVYRLCVVAGKTYSEADSLTQKRDSTGKRTLYGHATAWSRAKGTAEEILLNFRPSPALPSETII